MMGLGSKAGGILSSPSLIHLHPETHLKRKLVFSNMKKKRGDLQICHEFNFYLSFQTFHPYFI